MSDTENQTAAAAEPKVKKTRKPAAKKAAKKGKVKKAAKKGNSGSRNAKFSDTARIKLLVKENPRREGTEAYQRFAKFKNNMTVGDFVKSGKEGWDMRGTLIASVKRKQIQIVGN